MARVNSAVSRHIAKAPGSLRPVVTEEVAGNFGSMVLDSSGLVFKCSDSAARMLGGSAANVEGSPIWSLIADLMPSDTSPSFNARFLAHLSSTGCWREFQAIDIAGQCFPVQLAMSKLNSDGAGLFLIHLRQPLRPPSSL